MKTDSIIELPPHSYEAVITELSQVIDWGLKQTGVPNTWKITAGRGCMAVVIDSGHPQHDDIGDNAIEGKNFVGGEDIYDYEGHQTHVTGIICAKNNDMGMVGVAPEAKCITLKALDSGGRGRLSAITRALEYALTIKPDVVSMSLGSVGEQPEMHDVIKELYKANIPVVCAAGNSGRSGVNYPALYPETIAVGAYDSKGNIANFSSIGDRVDVAAPGVDIYSTYLNNSYSVMNGTSMACPFVTGIILLLKSKHMLQEKQTGQNDCKTVDEIKQHLIKYTVDRGIIGKDQYYGYGTVDVQKLLEENGETPLPQISNVVPWYKRFLRLFKK